MGYQLLLFKKILVNRNSKSKLTLNSGGNMCVLLIIKKHQKHTLMKSVMEERLLVFL